MAGGTFGIDPSKWKKNLSKINTFLTTIGGETVRQNYRKIGSVVSNIASGHTKGYII